MNSLAAELNEKGLQHLAHGDINKALECFRQAMQEAPDFPDPYANIANILASSGENEDALVWFKKAISLDPEGQLFQYGAGNVYFNLEDYPSAKEHYIKAEKLGMQHHDLYFMLALTSFHLEELSESIARFDQSLQLEPQDIEATFTRGLALARMGDIARAKEAFEKTIHLQPDHGDGLFNLGVAYAYLGDIPAAKEHLQRAVELNPQHVLAQNALQQLQNL